PLARGGRVPARLPLASDTPRPGRLVARPNGGNGDRADLREAPPGAARATSAADLRATSNERILELPARYTTRATPAARADGGAPPAEPVAGPRLTPLRPPTRRELEPPAPGRASASTPAARSGAAPKASHANAGRAVCPYCGGAGYVRQDVPLGDPTFGKPVPCVCKERELEARRRSDLQTFSSLDPFTGKTFATFDPAIAGLRESYDAARAFAADPQGWLVLAGPHGVGKTHLAAAIANAHLEAGNPVFFSIVPDLLDHLRAAFAPTSEVPYDALFDRIREAGLLVLDDLGAENSTAWATEKLFQLINYRYNYRMPTVITTNTRLITQMDERIRSRLSDISLSRHCAIKAQDYRERHVDRARRPGGAQGGPRAR
ncbi:MAG TPA: ATP-binding protein, partial [Ktedonobacterales bacterium]|nr:ATP-binding protein [Ktedonobacterales bacterium]